MDDDTDTEKDDAKRKSRNLSEKKRRDQFNVLVTELSLMVSSNSRKMDKSSILKSSIAFLREHNEIAVRSRVHEIQEEWKPSCLSNEEFTQLILEALDGFVIIFSATGQIYYASDNVTSLLGHLPSDLLKMTIYDLAYEEDHSNLFKLLVNPRAVIDPTKNDLNMSNKIQFTCHLKRGGNEMDKECTYELVEFMGYFRNFVEIDEYAPYNIESDFSEMAADPRLIFVGTSQIQTLQLVREMFVNDCTTNAFTSRHSLEWKFLFLDHRAPPIIGYLPIEVLGTSGYDYYHFDDLDNVITCHESLMKKGEATSCQYRFLTKGQQWIWLQTRSFISYHQWHAKPEFIVCTHRIVNYMDVAHQVDDKDDIKIKPKDEKSMKNHSPAAGHSSWPTKKSRKHHKSLTEPSTSKHSTSIPYSTKSRPRHIHNYAENKSFAYAQTQPDQFANTPPEHFPIPPYHHHHHPPPQIITPAYLEPQQYLTAIPLQPVIPATFPTAATVIQTIQPSSELIHQGMVMTSSQGHIQEQLQRKHEELQDMIVHQQEELRHVSEQLLMARYGLLPPLVNVAIPFNTIAHDVSRNQTNGNIMTVAHSVPLHVSGMSMTTDSNQTQRDCHVRDDQSVIGSISQQADDILSYMQLTPPSNSIDYHQQSSHMPPPQMVEFSEHMHQIEQCSSSSTIQHTSHHSHSMEHQQRSYSYMIPNMPSNELDILPYEIVEEQPTSSSSQILYKSPTRSM